jgi:hypothetical protein
MFASKVIEHLTSSPNHDDNKLVASMY